MGIFSKILQSFAAAPGELTLELVEPQRERTAPGEELAIRLRVPNSPDGAQLVRAHLDLRAVEAATYLGKGMGPGSKWNIPYEAEAVSLPWHWEAGASSSPETEVVARWRLPPDAPVSLAPTPHNEIYWEVRGQAEMAGAGAARPFPPMRVAVGIAAPPELGAPESGFERATGSDEYKDRYELCWTVPQRVRPGETLAGEVTFTANMIVKCRSAELRFFCLAHGKGERDRVFVERRVLHQGEIAKGAVIGGRFEFAVTPGVPPTYHGKVVELEWRLELFLDVHGAMQGYAPVFTDIRESVPVEVGGA